MIKIKFSKQNINQFKKLGVETIYLFGSQAQGNIHSLSDIDIGIIFCNPEKYRNNTIKVYNKLYNIFIGILPQEYLRRRFKMEKHEIDIEMVSKLFRREILDF